MEFGSSLNLEKYVIFASDFQLNLYSDLDEIFIDATFKVAPHNWYQLLNIFGYIKNKKFYLPMAHILMNSKTVQLYEEVFSQLVKKIKSHSNLKSFHDIKIMADFEIPMRKAIKNCFEGCLLDGFFFHFC